MFKIALVGSHGTGKSTLLTALSERLVCDGLSVTILEEIPRSICNRVGSNSYFQRSHNSCVRQLMLLFAQVVEENTNTSTADYFLTDRSVVDHWVYTRLLFQKDIENHELDKLLPHWIFKYLATYNLVLHLPVEFGPANDGVREDDFEFQTHVGDSILQFLQESGVYFVTVRGSVESRIGESIEAIKSLGTRKRED